MTTSVFERVVRIATPTALLDAALSIPPRPRGLVLIVDGSGDPIHVPGNQHAVAVLREAGYATLRVTLLGGSERAEDVETGELRFDLPLLANRLLGAVAWAAHHPSLSRLRVGIVAGGTCVAAALAASAEDEDGRISAIVSRGGRPELASASLSHVRAPTLLIVGELDEANLPTNQRALELLPSGSRLQIVTGAHHLLEDGDEAERAAQLTAAWFDLAFTPAPRELVAMRAAAAR